MVCYRTVKIEVNCEELKRRPLLFFAGGCAGAYGLCNPAKDGPCPLKNWEGQVLVVETHR